MSRSLIAILLFAQASPQIGAGLERGMQMHYTTGGAVTPWEIVAVNRDTAALAGARCVSVRLRFNPADTMVVHRIHCARGDTMFNWSAAAGQFVAARPLAAGTLITARADGGRVAYTSRGVEIDTVDGRPLLVVPTTVETFDRSGTLTQRLRERFAISLATATDGIFERPVNGVLQETQRFRLSRLVPGER